MKPEDPGVSNCHGYTFTDGEFMIHPKDAETVRDGEGYVESNDYIAGSKNIGMWYNKKGQGAHSTKINKGKDGTYGADQYAKAGDREPEKGRTLSDVKHYWRDFKYKQYKK